MSKKHNPIPKAVASPQAKPAVKHAAHPNMIPVIFIALYLFLDFIPECGALDVAGPQWLYFTIINGISAVYIFYYSKSHGYEQALKKILNITLAQIYLFLFALSGISILFAINKTESLVCYAGFINTIIAFLNIGILLNGRLTSFKLIAQLIAIVLLIQSVLTLSAFFDSLSYMPIEGVIYNLKGTTGNKNTLATSLVVKISFVMYCVYTFKSWAKFMYIPVLVLGAISIFIISTRSAYLGLFLQIGILLTFSILMRSRLAFGS